MTKINPDHEKLKVQMTELTLNAGGTPELVNRDRTAKKKNAFRRGLLTCMDVYERHFRLPEPDGIPGMF